MLGFTCPWVSFPLRDITRAQLRFLAEPPTPHFVPSSGFHNLSTASSALELTGLFHPAATSRVLFRSGASLPTQPPFLFGRSLPPCRCCTAARPRAPTFIGSRSVHVRRLSASRLRSAPGRVLQVRLFTSPKPAPLFEFHAPPGCPLSTSASARTEAFRSSCCAFGLCARAHLATCACQSPPRSRVVHVRPGDHGFGPRAVLQACVHPFRSGCSLRGARASRGHGRDRAGLRRGPVTSRCSREDGARSRVTPAHLAVIRACGVAARISFSSERRGVAGRGVFSDARVSFDPQCFALFAPVSRVEAAHDQIHTPLDAGDRSTDHVRLTLREHRRRLLP